MKKNVTTNYDVAKNTYKATKPKERLVIDSYGVCHFLPVGKSRYEAMKELREAYNN